MKRFIIIYVNGEEFEQIRKKYPNAQYHESDKYKKLRVSSRKEVRYYPEQKYI
jgi:hypothetical protein